jgi:hypothetical protein
MEFCNLVGKVDATVLRRLGMSSGIPLKMMIPEACEVAYAVASDVSVCSNGKEVYIASSNKAEDSNLFSLETADVERYVFPAVRQRKEYKQENMTTWEEVQETEENPAIAVLCKAVHFVKGVETCFRVLNVNSDCVLVMLICGALGFECADGEVLTMTRNWYGDTSNRKTMRVTPYNLNEYFVVTDKSGYKFNMDMVITACVKYSDGLTVKVLRDYCFIIDPESSTRIQKIYDAKAEADKLRAEERAQNAEATARYLARQERERLQKEDKASSSGARKSKTEAEKAAERTDKAASFLDMVAAMSHG